MRRPISTYRLQIRPEFDLNTAATIVDYLHDLGVDWLYLSPVLKSEAGSEHGYDVTDHSVIDPARGGAAGLEALSSAARGLGMGLLIDIVPNHMGVATPADNAWWWDVLTHGRQSRYAEAFDIDWQFGGGRVRIPVLADPPPGAAQDTELDALEIVDGELSYRGTRYPLAPGSDGEGASARAVHDRQHYELVNWRRADAEANYRRFFAVNTLAGIRVEVPWVFDESHAEIVRWIAAGLADGLRIDHPDGLADPAGYLDRLAEATGGTYVVVEKILQPGERLPSSWSAAGTTGYDAVADIDRVLIDPAGEQALETLDAQLRAPDPPVSWPDLIHDRKRAVADGILRSEVLRVARDLRRAAAVDGDRADPVPVEDSEAVDAIAELLACFPVYRSYLPLGTDHLRQAAALARGHRPDLRHALDEVMPALADAEHPAAIRFQQTSGMVMAKGVEDTAFYRYTRLGSLTEVGADPSEFSISVEEFHRRQQARLAVCPAALTTLSTHDTKRGEDVRARIDVLSEMPAEWEAALRALRRAAPLGDPPLEILLWQAVIGAWPADRDRLHRYAEKAAREAGDSTSWAVPRAAFEARLHELVDSAFDDEEVRTVLAGIVETVRQPGWSNSLSAKLIQLTAPGVPDVYQGSELWETSLVDPDNRRPVDFELRRRLLTAIGAGALPPVEETGAAKLLVTARALRLRRDSPQLFSRYLPVVALGAAADHIIAFDRGGAVTVATRLPLGLARGSGWRDTTIVLAGRPVEDVITGRSFAGGPLPASELLRHYPVALLRPIGR